MSDSLFGRLGRLAPLAGLLACPTAALALPWDIDMVDGQAVKAYSEPMRTLPEGTVSQAHVLTPRGFTPNWDRNTADGQALVNPVPADDAHLALGKRMWETYCTPCHGDGVKLGPVAAPGRFPGVPVLAGSTGVLGARTDGWIYLTIRNGGAIMPAYGKTMNDTEMWSIVHYTRKMPNAAYAPPKPAEEAK